MIRLLSNKNVYSISLISIQAKHFILSLTLDLPIVKDTLLTICFTYDCNELKNSEIDVLGT